MVEHCRATCQPGTRYTATRMSYTAAVVGLGTIAGAHLSAIEDQQRLRLTGVCDIDRDILARRGAETSVPGFHDYRELLQTAPDVVVVALPHHLHCDVAVAALEAGCHVLVEKPLAVSVEQCRTLLQAARRARRILAVSDTAAYHPGALLTGVHFRAGTLGRFLSGMHHNVRFYFHAGRPAWFLDPAASGGGMFANVGLHRLAQTRACLPGLVPCVVSAAVARLAEHPVEACTSALVRYQGGGAMHYEELGYITRPSWWPLSTHYLFEEGMVTFDAARWRLVTRASAEQEESLDTADNPYAPVYRDLLRRLDGEAALGPEAWESAADVAVVQGAYASAAAGRETDLTAPSWRIDPACSASPAPR